MNKAVDRLLKKVGQILDLHTGNELNLKFKNDGYKQFKLINVDGEERYELTSIHEKEIKNDELLLKLRNYLLNNGEPIILCLFDSSRIKTKSLTTAIMKENWSEPLINKLSKVFFNDYKMYNMRIALEYITQFKEKDVTVEKKIKTFIFNTINNFKSKNIDYVYSNEFSFILDSMSRFKYEEKDFNGLHVLFNFFKKSIKEDTKARKTFVEFLKKSINTSDWDVFLTYYNIREEIKNTNKLFESKEYPKYHLIINESLIIEKNPILLLESDYRTMLAVLVKHINLNADDLGIESCKIISLLDKKSELYFVSNTNKEIDSELLKGIILSSIDVYVEATKNKEAITDLFLDKTFKALILSLSLEDKKENINKRKLNKI